MRLAYNGANYHGWQSQPNAVTVQSSIEDALAKFMRRAVPIVGAGRTDTGVNARMMIAHLDLEPTDIPRLIGALNAMLGPDIAIESLTPVADDAHARFDATSRTYRYFTHDHKSPFLRQFSWQAPAGLDYQAMNQAAAMMIGQRDFTSFSKLHTDTRTNICNLTGARWIDLGEGRHCFEITADRFLRNMVRAVVGTLVEIGRHKLQPNQIIDIIDRQDRGAAGTSMPPHPLFLWHISYPYIK